MSEYNGYDLFMDVQDPKLRLSNRLQVCVNILSSNMKEDKVTPGGIKDFLLYLKQIPFGEERQELIDNIRHSMLGEAMDG